MKKLFSLLLSVLILLSCVGCGGEEFIGKLYLYLPGEYISQDVIKAFEKEYKIDVVDETFGSNEEMYTNLLGGVSYDVIIPSDYMLEKMIQENMVQKIDKSIVTNLSDLYDGVKNQEYDPNNDYTVPYFWGNVGIVYDINYVSEEDVVNEEWEVLRNTDYASILYMYDSSRDSFMIPLKALGYSMNSDNDDELNAAYEWLIEQNKTMDVAYASDECIDGLAFPEDSDNKHLGVMYSGDAAYILSENENMRFYAPVNMGTNFWVDAMVIPTNAKNVEYANQFINYMISYDAQYGNSSEIGYCTVNKDALKDLAGEDGDFADNEAYLPRERTAVDETFHYIEKTKTVTSELWSKVMAN